jgi:hypothetical protein
MSTPIDTAGATQVQHPWKATLRTIVQVGIPALLTLCLVVPQVVDAVLAGFGEQLPPEFTAWMLASAGFVTTLAAVITRVMAIPAINAWLTSLGLGATPKA